MPNFLRSTLALIIAGCLLSVPFLVIRVGYVVDLIGARNQIDQLRSDMINISDLALGDVVGQATAWNQTIRSRQAYNNTWWGDPLIPDEWDNIAMLSMPNRFSSPVPASLRNGGTVQGMDIVEVAAPDSYQGHSPMNSTPPSISRTSETPAADGVMPALQAKNEKPLSSLEDTSLLRSDGVASSMQLIPPVQVINEGTYTVQQGDTLELIADRFGTTVAQLIQLNNLASSVITPSQQLIVTPNKGFQGGR